MASGAVSPRSPCCLQCPNVYTRHSPNLLPLSSSPPPQFCQTPLWATSASWMTVSMWQSSLRWKRSRMLGVSASFTKLGFHPFHSVCQWLGLWMKAFETMPGFAVSDQWASSVVGCSLRWFGILLKEFGSPFGDMEWKGSAKGHPTALLTMERDEEEEDGARTKQDSCGLIWIWLSVIFPADITGIQDSRQVKHLLNVFQFPVVLSVPLETQTTVRGCKMIRYSWGAPVAHLGEHVSHIQKD